MCPICKKLEYLFGYKNNKKVLFCGHSFKFNKSRSQKEMDRKYIKTIDGGIEFVK